MITLFSRLRFWLETLPDVPTYNVIYLSNIKNHPNTELIELFKLVRTHMITGGILHIQAFRKNKRDIATVMEAAGFENIQIQPHQASWLNHLPIVGKYFLPHLVVTAESTRDIAARVGVK